ncbi:MAG: hypothetical protein JWP10_1761 [Nocardioidaceae bacterium]|nr:hypothetical protein [Nocardioidaceae bacterium]
MTRVLPTIDEVHQLPIGLTIVVPSGYEDTNGHMNIRHYFDLHALNLNTVFDGLGIDDHYRAERKMGFFTMEHHLSYWDEVLVGHELSLRWRHLTRSDKVLHSMSFLVDETTGRLANTLEVTCGHVSLETRKMVSMPDDTSAFVDKQFGQTSGLTWAAPICGAMGVRKRS